MCCTRETAELSNVYNKTLGTHSVCLHKFCCDLVVQISFVWPDVVAQFSWSSYLKESRCTNNSETS